MHYGLHVYFILLMHEKKSFEGKFGCAFFLRVADTYINDDGRVISTSII